MTFKMTGKSRTITVYNYRADTCEFIGKGDALIPNGRWNTTEDHRGEIVFDTETGHLVEITEPGKYPTGTTTAAPENQWQKWNGKAWVDDAVAKQNAQIEDAKNLKNTLLKNANENIATLQDAVDFDMATESEISQLKAWKQYRVRLNRVDPYEAPEIIWPDEI